MPSEGLPYELFSFAGLVPWMYFASAVSGGAASLAGSRYLIGKVYFPRVLVPLAAILMPAVDMLIALSMMGVLMAWFGVVPTSAVLVLPVLLLFVMLIAFSLALWTSALTVRYRDMRYLIPFGTQLLLLPTVAMPVSMLPAQWRVLCGLNPMATVVEGFRMALLGTNGPGAMAIPSVLVVAVLLVTGFAYFRSVESSIVDLI